MKHFLVVAMLMVSASCAAFGLQPNKAVSLLAGNGIGFNMKQVLCLI